MKKYVILICSFVLSALLLIGCNKTTSKNIVLPSVKEINSVVITDNKAKYVSNDKDVILKLTDKMNNATDTNKESVQDVPDCENYIEINLITKDYTTTYFMYFNKGKLTLEQPYVGIYLVDNSLNEVVNSLYDFNLKK